jgi:hypothetical protein
MDTDRPVLDDEIEVTPEMIEAGAKILLADASCTYGTNEAHMVSEEIIKCALAASSRGSASIPLGE